MSQSEKLTSQQEDRTVSAFPTKRFFIDMLTRDIELQDAILDLLDNCVDGVQRTSKGRLDPSQPYSGYWAKVEFSSDHFMIIDNCGGIPIDLAKRYAFMLGRPIEEDAEDADIPTVGMYGIGMKRAIFKMGRNAIVTSQTQSDSYQVSISNEWMNDDKNWKLPLEKIKPSLDEMGTKIEIKQLSKGTALHFTQIGTSSFSKTLMELIGHHFSFIIRKGFAVSVNGEAVSATPFSLLWSEDSTPAHERIAPFLYKADRDNVEIRLAVGFHTPMISNEELDEEQKTKRSKEDAGWTIICNDRVVVYNDKSRLTGWGESGVPSYHSQFIGIAGVVLFKSNDAWKLPITTTKRGLDTSSDLYLYIKDFMKEGLKRFTNHTNAWKSNEAEERRISANAKSVPMEELLFSEHSEVVWTKVHNRANELKYAPSLAVPLVSDPNKQVRFSRKLSEIRAVSKKLFDDPDIPPGQVGEACFEHFLKK